MVGLTKKAFFEGDYSDWIIYDSFDDTTLVAMSWEHHAFINREESEAILIDENFCKRYTIATKTLSASLFDPSVVSGAAMAQAGAVRSAYGTYVVWIDEARDNLYIMKNGAIVKTMSYSDLGLDSGFIYSVAISPKGTYIFVTGVRSATGNRGWVVLVGS